MARIVITGAAGFLGQRLVQRLLREGTVRLADRDRPIEALFLTDQVPTASVSDPRVTEWTGPLATCLKVAAEPFTDADVVFHLASAVSGECEADWQLGLDANLAPGVELARVLAASPKRPVLVFASSVAVYGAPEGAPWPCVITDQVRPMPQNSYGSQKLMLETLYADLHRKGLLSARSLRLMTVSVRPGAPNGAASGFLSAIVREPLMGRSVEIPVKDTLPVALNSPEGAVAGLLHAAALSDSVWGEGSAVNLPGQTVTVAQMIDALVAVGGDSMREYLLWSHDPAVEAIVGRWPSEFDSARARRLGFGEEPPFETVIRQFLADISH